MLPYLGLGRLPIALAAKILTKIGKIKPQNDKLTEHGKLRLDERSISQKEIEIAINTAKKSGKVETKIGKYGTRQIHYKGENGLSVIVETEGRNAGKVITLYRH